MHENGKRIFSLKLLAIIAFTYLVVLGYCHVFYYHFTFPQTLVTEHATQFVERVSSPPDLLFVGDSTSATALVASRFGENAHSIALFGGSLQEGRFLLERLNARGVFPRCLVLTFSYNWGPYISDDKGHLWSIHMGLYEPKELSHMAKRAEESGMSSEIPRWKIYFAWLMSKIWILHAKPEYVQESIFSDVHKLKIEDARKMVAEWHGNLNKVRDDDPPMITSPGHDYLFQPFHSVPIWDSYLEEILAMAQRYGTEVHFVLPPYHRVVQSDPKAARFLEGLSRHLRSKLAPHRNARFHAMPPPYPDDHYNDATHLNTTGALRFTEELKARNLCLPAAR